MRVSLLASSLLMMLVPVGCDAGGDAGADGVTASAAALSEGTPEAIGLLAFVNAQTTTVSLLDLDVGLDARAAKALIARRDGADKKPGTADDRRFATVAEVDAVSYVGTKALDALVSYARAHGFVPAGAQTLGTYDGVLFTADEAAQTLAFTNAATATQLDHEVGLDARAVKAIVAARPLATVQALSKLSYVGGAALRALKAAAAVPTPPPVATLPAGVDVAAHLAAVSKGLLHTSESDYPFTVVRIPGAGNQPLTLTNVKAVLASVYQNRPQEPTLAQRASEIVTLASFFDHYVVPGDWWGDYEKAQAPAFQAVEKVLTGELLDVQVFRFGTREGAYLQGAVDVFIIGRTQDGEIVGISTISVET